MKSLIHKILNKFGYQIRRIDSGFAFNSNLNWLRKYDINTILDIGANEGQFAKYINSQIPGCTIYSFEPIEKCYLELIKLKEEMKNLHPINYALGEVSGTSSFYVNEFTPSSSLLKMEVEHIKNFPNTKNSVLESVNVKKLDDIINDLKIKKEVLVKIDVQGFENKVILGGENFFLKIPKIVIIEASIIKLYQNEATFEELFNKFTQMGYAYSGNLYQLYSPIDGQILQIDAVFIKQ